MMQSMRNSAKTVFFLVLLAFAGFMILQGLTSLFSKPSGNNKVAPPGVIGEVDGVTIPLTYFENAYRPRVRQLLQENEEPPEEELQKIRDEIWNNLTTVTLLENEASRLGIVITNAEIVEYMKLSPPQDLQQSEQFATNGKFDIQKYQDWLVQMAASNDPQVITFLNNFENQIRQQITLGRLQNFVVSMVRVTPDQVKSDFMDKNEKVKVKYFFIPGSDFKDSISEVSEQELLAKYERDKEKYKNPAQALVSYVQFPKQPSDEDYAAVKARIDSLRNAIIAGADFAEAAKEFSDDKNSGANGGELGWYREGQMVEPFWKATTELAEIGQISEPVKTQFGWHLIKLTGKREIEPDSVTHEKRYEYQASHILLKVDMSQETAATIEEKANLFEKDAVELGFEKAADEQGLEVLQTKKFSAGGYIPEFGSQKDIADFAFNGKSKDVSRVISTRNAFVVCGLPEQFPESIPAFEEVKDRVENSYLYEKRNEAAYDRVRELAEEVKQGKTFDQAAEEAGKQIQETDFFARHEFVSRVGSDPAFIGTAFSLSKERPYSAAVKARAGSYLLEFIDRQEPDTTIFSTKIDSLVNAETIEKRKNIWPQFVNDLKNKADIVDYRSYYYGG